MIRKIYLHLLLWFFTIGEWFHWEYAKDQCKNLKRALFIDAMKKFLIEAINDNPNFLQEIVDENNKIDIL
jgi:hypothetical protein